MTRFSAEGLGSAVHDRRIELGLSQEELGKRAGYGKGGAVSISRIENGRMLPGDERIAKIAAGLELTTDVLFSRAVSLSNLTRGTTRTPAEIKERARHIEAAIAARDEAANTSIDAYNTARTRAIDEFLREFVVRASSFVGAPHARTQQPRFDIGAEALGALECIRFGIADSMSLARTIHEQSDGIEDDIFGLFASRLAESVWKSGAWFAGLPYVLTKLETFGGSDSRSSQDASALGTLTASNLEADVLPTKLLLGTGLVGFWLLLDRNRKQLHELDAKLDLTASDLATTASAFEQIIALRAKATANFEYVAVHGGHALRRWTSSVEPGVSTWDSLGTSDQNRYQDFMALGTALLALSVIDFDDIAALSNHAWRLAEPLLDVCGTQIRSLV